MKVKCVWTQTQTQTHVQTSTASKIRIYDAGNYVGFLFESFWYCYRVLNRNITSSGIEEELESMPEDWVPFSIYLEEEYPLLSQVSQGPRLELQIPGWTLQFVSQEEQELSATSVLPPPPQSTRHLSDQGQRQLPLPPSRQGYISTENGAQKKQYPSSGQRPGERHPQDQRPRSRQYEVFISPPPRQSQGQRMRVPEASQPHSGPAAAT